MSGLPCLIVLDSSEQPSPVAATLADVVACGDDLGLLLGRAGEHPVAATCLALVLRGSERRGVNEGLQSESAVYSTLLAGDDFRRWREASPRRERAEPEEPAVLSSRSGDVLTLTLNRPEVRNAFNARMRDELWDSLVVAGSDDRVRVEIGGSGEAFSSGGDLDEFGTAPDPARSHLIRLSRSVGRLVDDLSERITVELHGPCLGAGIEIPAFAGKVIARGDTKIGLPELSLGLIPGAGGTVSLPRRIGRHRTAWLALTGKEIDAKTALEWGLVDEVRGGRPDVR